MADQMRLPELITIPPSSSTINQVKFEPATTVNELVRPEPVRINEFVDPLLLQSLVGRSETQFLAPHPLTGHFSTNPLAGFPSPQTHWLYPPTLNTMQFDVRNLYSYLPAPPLRNPIPNGHHDEKDLDSGNETSSLSPAGTRTPLTNSPSSIPSR